MDDSAFPLIHFEVTSCDLKLVGAGDAGLFSFAEYPVASGLRSRSDYFGGVGCYGDEGEENPP